jgi:two-component system C4-dicarboxylate transport sensor histidine kinase DctB
LSYVGQNYGFRPYFTAAKAGEQSQFLAIGVTTGQPPAFSFPIRFSG